MKTIHKVLIGLLIFTLLASAWIGYEYNKFMNEQQEESACSADFDYDFFPNDGDKGDILPTSPENNASPQEQ
jgi:hypothetical protein